MFGVEWLGKILVIFGVVLVVVGLLLWVLGKFVPAGKLLPGDIKIERGNFTFYFPIVTCIVISIVLTLIFWLISWLRR